MDTASIQKLAEWVASAESIVVLTGAGISTASGIPDFRSASGVYSNDRNVNVFDLDAFRCDPPIFYTFAREFYPQVRDAHPNAALLDEAEARALEMVKSSSPDMPEDQQKELARAIGIGTIKYTDLSQNPQSLVTFTWGKALNMEGNSAPYICLTRGSPPSTTSSTQSIPIPNLANIQ